MAAPYSKFVFEEADLFGVDPELVAAIILQESGGREDAFRYEPGFAKRYLEGRSVERLGGTWPSKESHISEEQERICRASSFGLMQILGQVAREYGFHGDNLFDLLDPAINIHFGTMKLAAEIAKARERGSSDPVRVAVLRYNGGGEPRYDDQVFARVKTGQAGALIRDS